MNPESRYLMQHFDPRFTVFHELMPNRIRKVLLVFTAYDAFILEENGSLTSKIVSEYRGLNLSHPPRLIRASTGREALEILEKDIFDLVITMPYVADMDCFSLGRKIKKVRPDLPVILLAHTVRDIDQLPENSDRSGVDRFFVWSGDPEFMMSLVKNVEDHLNVAHDTEMGMVRVLVLVEDSPLYRSSFLPLLYREVVRQTQAVIDESLNQEHRLLKLRARPKILVAENFEDAVSLFQKYQPFVFGVISDTRFPRQGKMDDKAGVSLLTKIRKDLPDLPLLLLSAESKNRKKALRIPAVFHDKNSPDLLSEIHAFFLDHLGFGDFVFRMPDGDEIDRASNLKAFEEKLAAISDESLLFHAVRNHFSTWLMARSEVDLATSLFKDRLDLNRKPDEVRQVILSRVHALRKWRQSGVVAQFSATEFDEEVMEFVKIGKGSMGGKGLGLAFMSARLRQMPELHEKFPDVAIRIPRTCVITTDGFDAFVKANNLRRNYENDSDKEIAERFLWATLPRWLEDDLAAYLAGIKVPLSVRSSSVLEDAQQKPYAGLFSTYMVPNNHPVFDVRLDQLRTAVKLVYASTYFAGPRAFSRIGRQSGEDSMAIIIQELSGREYGDCFYPAISGVAQSYNYYPVGRMKAEEGIAHIALGMGKTVVEGEKSLRFSPKYPKAMPQFSTVDDMLENSQRFFYALQMRDYPKRFGFRTDSNLIRREIAQALDEFPVTLLSSTYIPEEHRIRDSAAEGPKVLTFARVLKYNIFPLAQLLSEFLEIGREGMGCPIEIEFSANLADDQKQAEFNFLQIRPMTAGEGRHEVQIEKKEIDRAFCYSNQALGHGRNETIADILYVKPDDFEPKYTREIAAEIGQFNGRMLKSGRPYLLVGPGRWGSNDRWLGIPVQWQEISGVGAMIEQRTDKLKADPSQGTHFFQNITSLGIHYVTVNEGKDLFDWHWLESLPTVRESKFVRHVKLNKPFVLKINGHTSQCVMYVPKK